jgi:hypothetical protein
MVLVTKSIVVALFEDCFWKKKGVNVGANGRKVCFFDVSERMCYYVLFGARKDHSAARSGAASASLFHSGNSKQITNVVLNYSSKNKTTKYN